MNRLQCLLKIKDNFDSIFFAWVQVWQENLIRGSKNIETTATHDCNIISARCLETLEARLISYFIDT